MKSEGFYHVTTFLTLAASISGNDRVYFELRVHRPDKDTNEDQCYIFLGSVSTPVMSETTHNDLQN